MQKLCLSPIASRYKPLCKLLIALSVFTIALSTTAPALAKERSCDWTLYVGKRIRGEVQNLSPVMKGTASGSSLLMPNRARINASKNIIACFKKATNSPASLYAVPQCSDVYGWNTPLINFLPVEKAKYVFVAAASSDTGRGCIGVDFFNIDRLI